MYYNRSTRRSLILDRQAENRAFNAAGDVVRGPPEVGLDVFGVGEHHRTDFAIGSFQALTVAGRDLCASAGDFDSTLLLNPRVRGRIEIGLADVVDLLCARAAACHG